MCDRWRTLKIKRRVFPNAFSEYLKGQKHDGDVRCRWVVNNVSHLGIDVPKINAAQACRGLSTSCNFTRRPMKLFQRGIDL